MQRLTLLSAQVLAFVTTKTHQSIALGLTLFEAVVVAGHFTELPGGIRRRSPEGQRPLVCLSTGTKQEDCDEHKCGAYQGHLPIKKAVPDAPPAILSCSEAHLLACGLVARLLDAADAAFKAGHGAIGQTMIHCLTTEFDGTVKVAFIIEQGRELHKAHAF